MHSLNSLLKPKSIAVIGGGSWCKAVIEQNQKIGFSGKIWPVHPTKREMAGLPVFTSITDLPSPPDVAFVGVNRNATIGIIDQLSAMKAGGAVCFASGFLETRDGAQLNDQLLEAAGSMPVLGPNCYGTLNALDSVALWPDQHGLIPVQSGVAILTQSSNIAINLTMQNRGLPIAMVVTLGNQVQLGMADMARHILRDERITAIGLHIESFGDLRSFEALAKEASKLNKPIVALKVGVSDEAQRATISHTASLAGSTAGSNAFLARLGIASVPSIGVFLETLKIFHCHGRLSGRQITSLSCSGGEASLIADCALRASLTFPPINKKQEADLKVHLSSMVHLANPLDYHTEIWRDKQAMTDVFATMSGHHVDLTLIVLDFPRDDICSLEDWAIALEAVEVAASRTGRPYAVVASIAENMPEKVARDLLGKGIIPLCDLDHACAAIDAAAIPVTVAHEPVLLPLAPQNPEVCPQVVAKRELAGAGLDIPKNAGGLSRGELETAIKGFDFPLVLKGEGIAHKTEMGAVVLNLMNSDSVLNSAREMPTERFLIEEMITGKIAELLVGIVRDPAHGFALTLAAGGTLTELLEDQESMLIPVSREAIDEALSKLKINAILTGFRGAEQTNRNAIIDTIMKLQSYVIANCDLIQEIEINPLICTTTRAVVADVLMVKGKI